MNRIAATLLAVGLVGGVSLPAFAVSEKAADTGAKRTISNERSRTAPAKDIDARLAEMKSQLKVTPAQEAQWNAFADVLLRQARAFDESMQKGKSERRDQKGTAIERLERRQQFLAEASTRATEVVAAAKPLYAAFSDEQKKVADQILDWDRRHTRSH